MSGTPPPQKKERHPLFPVKWSHEITEVWKERQYRLLHLLAVYSRLSLTPDVIKFPHEGDSHQIY